MKKRKISSLEFDCPSLRAESDIVSHTYDKDGWLDKTVIYTNMWEIVIVWGDKSASFEIQLITELADLTPNKEYLYVQVVHEVGSHAATVEIARQPCVIEGGFVKMYFKGITYRRLYPHLLTEETAKAVILGYDEELPQEGGQALIDKAVESYVRLGGILGKGRTTLKP